MAIFLELFPVIVFFAALFGIITSDNIIKTIVYTTILNAGVITFWIVLGSHGGTLTIPPLMHDGSHYSLNPHQLMADPVPQALMITAVVIGFSVTAVNIILLITLHRKYKTTDWKVLYKAVREEAMGYAKKKDDYANVSGEAAVKACCAEKIEQKEEEN